MTTVEGMRMSFRNMCRAAERVGYGPGSFELREGSRAAGLPHALLGPKRGQQQYLGMTREAATLVMEGMTRAFLLSAVRVQQPIEQQPAQTELKVRPNTPAEAAVLAAEIDPHVTRLGDHFEADI